MNALTDECIIFVIDGIAMMTHQDISSSWLRHGLETLVFVMWNHWSRMGCIPLTKGQYLGAVVFLFYWLEQAVKLNASPGTASDDNVAIMMASSNGNIFRVTGPLREGNPPVTSGFPSQKSLTRNFDVFFDLRLNKRLSKESRRLWFETPSCSLWRHCNDHENYRFAVTKPPEEMLLQHLKGYIVDDIVLHFIVTDNHISLTIRFHMILLWQLVAIDVSNRHILVALT